MSNTAKNQRLNEIKELILPFCEQHLNEELTGYVINLLNRLGRKRTISITRGKPEIWASAIIYVIARLNFLFSDDNSFGLIISADIITGFFKTGKSTVGQKATFIEDNCKISMGDPELCESDIVDMLTFYETPEGFIVSKNMLKSMNTSASKADTEKAKEIDAQRAEQRRQKELEAIKKKEQREEITRQKAAEKREQTFKNQGNLFEDD